MTHQKKVHPKYKSSLHPRNKHRERYDFKQLICSSPELSKYVKVNKYGDESIDFFNPEAVYALNSALLKHYYDIKDWNIPPNYLCPPIPGRADYIHTIADLMASSDSKLLKGKIPSGNRINILDIGVGANCIYPIIGNKEYHWSFIGSEIDLSAFKSAMKIVDMNPGLKGRIQIRYQSNAQKIFKGIIHKNEFIDCCVCNPPFHASAEDARSMAKRKLKNLKGKSAKSYVPNFGGQQVELWCEGGEKQFLQKMIGESFDFATSCFWFSSLVSKQSNLPIVHKALVDRNAREIKTIPLGQGNKKSRIVAWTFLTPRQRSVWIKTRWI